jgi:diguanylate cyclase (GGDEF)-like protein
MTLVNQALARAKKAGRQIAVAVVELDHFTMGEEPHEQIDRTMIYRIQAARLRSTLHTTDTVARLGERSFAALFLNVPDVADVAAVALKMHTALSMPVILQGREMFLTSRIGVAMSVWDTSDAERLLNQAAEAMVRAGKDGYALYGAADDYMTPARDVLSPSTRRGLAV